MAADHLTTALDALVSHLQAHLDAKTAPGAVPVVRGFRDDRELALETDAHVAVQAGSPLREGHAPVPLGIINGKRRWIVATWRANVQIDIQARHRDQRDELVQAITEALVDLPREGGLTLPVAAYYGERVRFRVTGDVPDEPGEDQPLTGPWGHIIELRAAGRVVVEQATPAPDLARVDLVVTDAASQTTTTTTITVPPSDPDPEDTP